MAKDLLPGNGNDARTCAAVGVLGFVSWPVLHVLRPRQLGTRYGCAGGGWYAREVVCLDIGHAVALGDVLRRPWLAPAHLPRVAVSCHLLAAAHVVELVRGRGDRTVHALSAVLTSVYGAWCAQHRRAHQRRFDVVSAGKPAYGGVQLNT